ncbi:MAG: exo-alpha-sialidase [Pirellulales bacterium]|nr:exo-alpha-sialidase [Pirellulales bacterium]
MKTIAKLLVPVRSLLVLAVLCGGSHARAGEPQFADVFVGGQDGYASYRIPSVIATPKGTLLAFCEGRKFNSLDESPTDMVLKRSCDGGKTWGALQIVVKAVPEAAMDSCPVIDRPSGKVVLVYDLWPEYIKDTWPSDYHRKPGLGRDSVTAWVTTSSDDGVTWSEPIDITATTKKPHWSNFIHGPGVGIQMRSGRIVIPCCYQQGAWRNFSIHSDDHGKTWQLGGEVPTPGVDESQVVERLDGSLLLNMRSSRGKGCRAIATSKDGGQNWSELVDCPALPEPVCQGSILRYTWPNQHGKSRILFCNPGTSKGREQGTVRLSYDEGATWSVAKVIFPGYFGYSCLALLPDMTIGCLFETAGCGKITYASFTLDWLTDGKDTIP